LRDRVSSREAAPLFDRYAIVSIAPTTALSECIGALLLCLIRRDLLFAKRNFSREKQIFLIFLNRVSWSEKLINCSEREKKMSYLIQKK
jgi:hypothetical protein